MALSREDIGGRNVRKRMCGFSGSTFVAVTDEGLQVKETDAQADY